MLIRRLDMYCACVCWTVENPAHCDFVKLRNMLVRTHMQDLKDVTRETHYENYRAHCIQSMTRMVVKERNRKYALLIPPAEGALAHFITLESHITSTSVFGLMSQTTSLPLHCTDLPANCTAQR